MPLKILFIGDVVGSPGRKIVGQVLPRLIRRWELGLVVCNAENAAGGSGLTVKLPRGAGRGGRRRLHAGRPRLPQGRGLQPLRADRPAAPAGQFPRRRRPARSSRWPRPATGRPSAVFTLLGRTYMRPVDCPFRAADRVLERIGADGPGHPRRHPRRGDQRQATARPLPRRPRLRRARDAHPRRHGRRADPARRDRLPDRRRHDRARTTRSSAGGTTASWPRRSPSSPPTSTSRPATPGSTAPWSRSIPRPAAPCRSGASASTRKRPAGS